MYIYCDGTLTVDMAGSPQCDSWVSVIEAALLNHVWMSKTMTESDFYILSAEVITLFIIGFGIKMMRKTMNV